MTGYGRGEIEEKGVRITAELRSVNNRFLEISTKLPRFLTPIEPDIKELIQSRISRGRITASIAWDESSSGGETISLDEELADRYYDLLVELKKRYDLAGQVDLATFAALPDLLKREVPEWEPDEALPLVKEAVEIALDELMAMKTREGSALAEDIKRRINVIFSRLDMIERRSPERVEEVRERLNRRLKELVGSTQIDESLLMQEVVLFAERADCTEEVVRARIHCEHLIECIEQGGAVGRKLNFLLQELGREANTIGAKAQDAYISENVVLIKEELEKIREQVQNIE